MNINVFPMFCFASALMCSTVFAEIGVSISQSSQQHQSISERVAPGQIAIGHGKSREIQVNTLENYAAQSLQANFETKQDLNNLDDIKNTDKFFNDVHVTSNERVDEANGTDSTRKITSSQLLAYRKITYGIVVAGICKYGFSMIQMRFRQDQSQSALIDHIVEPPATSRCLFVTRSIKLIVGQTVALARDSENNFVVI